jgi:hypothetical protein
MTDSFTKEPVQVSTDGDSGPYIMVQLDQLGIVQRVLDEAKIRYSVDEDAISFNDRPFTAVVNLTHDVDITAVQKLLDAKGNLELLRDRRPKSGRRR